MGKDSDARRPEWRMFRATKSVSDLMDEKELASFIGVNVKRLRHLRSRYDAPVPIARPDNLKPLWPRDEILSWAENMKRHESTRQIIRRKRFSKAKWKESHHG